MKLGYARVSTTDQDLSIQRDRLYAVGCGKLFEEKTSGVGKKRPALERLLSELRADDVVVLTRLDRLARSTSELLRIAEFERSLIVTRTEEGRRAAQARGVPSGRPPKLRPDQRALARRLIEEGKSVTEVARTFNVHVATIYRCLRDQAAL